MTLVALFAMLAEHGIRRARVLEYIGEVELQLPWFGDHSAFKAELERLKPLGMMVTYTRLAWWRCWFRPYQAHNMMHLGLRPLGRWP